MSLGFSSLKAQLVPEVGGGYSSYRPKSKSEPGRYFYSEKRPVSLTPGVADSFEEALANDQFRFWEDGERYLISPQATDLANTYRLKIQSELARGKDILNKSRQGARLKTSELSTASDADLDLAARKIVAINSQQRQFHHMMDLDSYAPFFQGVSDEGKALMIGMLNQKGFYPGDDRRNYIGLGGNQWFKPGKGNGVRGISNNEHQGGIHVLLSENRRNYPLPGLDQISLMGPEQRVEVMLPHLIRDRQSLHQVLSRRTEGLSDRVSAEPRITKENIETLGQILEVLT